MAPAVSCQNQVTCLVCTALYTLWILYLNSHSKSLRSAETYLYAGDTTIYCIAETMDLLTNSLNNIVLAELQEWWDRNSMVPHPEKCKAMIMQRKSTFTAKFCSMIWPGQLVINLYSEESFWGCPLFDVVARTKSLDRASKCWFALHDHCFTFFWVWYHEISVAPFLEFS